MLITISSDTIIDSEIPPTRDPGVDPISLETKTMGIAHMSPVCYEGDNALLKSNHCTSDTKDDLVLTTPFTSSKKGEGLPSTANSCSATHCGTRIFSANAVLQARTVSTSNLLEPQLSTNPKYSVCNPYFPGTNSRISTSQLLPRLLKESTEPRSAENGLKDFIPMDPPILIRGLPGGSAITRPAGHRRGRPLRTSCEHSWQEVLLCQYYGRRRGRPARSFLLLPGRTN